MEMENDNRIGDLIAVFIEDNDVLWEDTANKVTFQVWLVTGSKAEPYLLTKATVKWNVNSVTAFATDLPNGLGPGIVATVSLAQPADNGSMVGLLWQRGGGSFTKVQPDQWLVPDASA